MSDHASKTQVLVFIAAMIGGFLLVLSGLYLVVVQPHSVRAEWYAQAGDLKNALALDPYRADLWRAYAAENPQASEIADVLEAGADERD